MPTPASMPSKAAKTIGTTPIVLNRLSTGIRKAFTPSVDGQTVSQKRPQPYGPWQSGVHDTATLREGQGLI